TRLSPNTRSVTTAITIAATAYLHTLSLHAALPISGTVAWSDGGAGGSFSNAGTCTLSTGSSQSQCNVTYTASSTAGSVTITGSYSGDPTHVAGSGTDRKSVE